MRIRTYFEDERKIPKFKLKSDDKFNPSTYLGYMQSRLGLQLNVLGLQLNATVTPFGLGLNATVELGLNHR